MSVPAYGYAATGDTPVRHEGSPAEAHTPAWTYLSSTFAVTFRGGVAA
jgi:hypothetical protein